MSVKATVTPVESAPVKGNRDANEPSLSAETTAEDDDFPPHIIELFRRDLPAPTRSISHYYPVPMPVGLPALFRVAPKPKQSVVPTAMDEGTKITDYAKQEWEYLIHGSASITKGAMVNSGANGAAAVTEYQAKAYNQAAAPPVTEGSLM